MRVCIVAPHIFMQDAILPDVIFSPGRLAIDLADSLIDLGAEVTLFTPGAITTRAKNHIADLSFFQAELDARGDGYLDLLKKHPLTFISLARQVQAELLAAAFRMANADQFDVVHVYMNEEEMGLPFSELCTKPVLFTHHDPFSFLAKYRSIFPKYRHLNWLSLSMAQRDQMPADTHWVGNISHGLDPALYRPAAGPSGDYLLYLGRIIESKGLHLAIAGLKNYNAANPDSPYKLKIAGKHYAGVKDEYWQNVILPEIDGEKIEYIGFVKDTRAKAELLAHAAALVVPSIFAEPFGMVMIESLACGTPVVGLRSGAIPEVVRNGETGVLVDRVEQNDELNTAAIARSFAQAYAKILKIDRQLCRQDFLDRFTLTKMAEAHLAVYESLKNN